MRRITLNGSSAGYTGFPSGFRILGHDDLGDPIAVDDHGVVWVFAHGTGDREHKTKAFESEQLLHEHVVVPGAPCEWKQALALQRMVSGTLTAELGKQKRSVAAIYQCPSVRRPRQSERTNDVDAGPHACFS